MLAEAEHGLTDMAMNNGRFHGDEYLLVKFFTHPRLNQSKSADAGRPIYEDTPYIQIMQPGNKDSIVQRPATDMDKNRFAEHYRKFEAREEQEGVEGTLLEEWPGITRSQCEELKFLNVRTVEQLANISDSNAQNIMGIGFLKQKANNYLESSKDEATIEALAAANARIDQLVAMVEAQGATPVDVEEKPKAKRRRRTAQE